MACQYFASNINNKRGTVKFWNFVRKENLSLWEGFCKFILKHDISNRRRTWACPRQKCVKERQAAYVAVVKVVKSYLVAIIFAEWDTSDISLVKYQLYTSTNFQFLCSSTVWICAHCQQDLRSVYTVHRITTRFLVNKVNYYRLWTAPIQFIWMPRRKKYNAKRQTNKQPQTFSSQKLDICWKWFYFINLGNISSHVFREDPNVQRLIWVICNFVESVSHIQIWQLALL